jgi:4,5-dihydroxyphthalate decarboxylase
LRLTIALERYDRHVPFFTNTLDVPAGIDLVPFEVGMVAPGRHGLDRHGRMLRDREFDAAEVSLASYIIAKSRGAPLTAIPVFPRRLFSQNHIFVATNSNLRQPRDLLGKRIVVYAFQVTMSVLAKGDLKRDYGLPWEHVHWLTLAPEEISLDGHQLPITQLAPKTDPVRLLLDGGAEALVHPHPPHAAQSGADGIRRLFEDTEEECLQYFHRNQYYPIMHLIAIKEELAQNEPGLPSMLMRLWDQANDQTNDFYDDPGYSTLAFARLHYEEQRARFGVDIWPNGIRANRTNLERFIADMVDQRLIPVPVSVDQLFCDETLKS